MSTIEREWFYLRLNLKRRDPDSIRCWIDNQILNFLWKNIIPWIWTTIAGILSSAMTVVVGWIGFHNDPHFYTVGIFGAALSAGFGSIKTLTKKDEIEKEPANISLDKFVKVPDYTKKAGFIHQVVKDLDLVFETIPNEYKEKPIVIFIDDLDRCSPTKVAQVVEGINLFLAREFPDCIFVIGMDAEMVAAALEVAHKQVISKLPIYSMDIPIGWRFMDKFVQLPLVIPPSMPDKLKDFVTSLLIEYKQAKKPDVIQNTDVSENTSQTDLEPEEVLIMKEMNQEIATISDLDEGFLNEVSEAACEFSNNPRDIKRFMNLFRFYRFLMTNNSNKIYKSPTFQQLRRWTILCLKWPHLVRWLYHGQSYNGNSGQKEIISRKRLEFLEKTSINSKDHDDWKNMIIKELDLQTKNNNVQWIDDQNLFDFFKRELTQYSNATLSEGAGQGLY